MILISLDVENDDFGGHRSFDVGGQVRSNLMVGAEISEIEMILEAERRKFKDTREKMEEDLNIERKTRVEFENKLMRLKVTKGV